MADDTFKLLVGEGADAGTVRLLKDAKGPLRLREVTFRKGIQYGHIRMGSFEGLPPAKVESIPVKHRVLEHGIELDIPALRQAAKPAFNSLMR